MSSYDETKATHFAKRVLQVAQRVTVGSLVLLVGCALAAARINSTSLQVHPIPLTVWAVVAAMSAVGLAALVTDPDVAVRLSPLRRRALGSLLMTALLVAVTGVVANADGVAAPTWVLFLPVVVVSGAVLGPAIGLLVGALAGVGIYAAAGHLPHLDHRRDRPAGRHPAGLPTVRLGCGSARELRSRGGRCRASAASRAG